MMVYRKHRDSWETSILKKRDIKPSQPLGALIINVNNSKDDGDANIDIFSSKTAKKEYESPPWWPQRRRRRKEAAEKTLRDRREEEI